MKLLTATDRTQGQRAGDYHWCTEGEVVIPAVVICDRDRNDPDGGCGCGRAWAGLNSHKATTTAAVREVDGYTVDDLTTAVRSGLQQMGWYPRMVDDDAVASFVNEVRALADSYPVGAVLETRLGVIHLRAEDGVEG